MQFEELWVYVLIRYFEENLSMLKNMVILFSKQRNQEIQHKNEVLGFLYVQTRTLSLLFLDANYWKKGSFHAQKTESLDFLKIH